MDELQESESTETETAPAGKPRTVTVLGVLALAAAIFSYLGAYAVTDALAKANVIAAVPRSPDPRLRWAAISFAILMVTSLLIGGIMRRLSLRQFRRIDQMLE